MAKGASRIPNKGKRRHAFYCKPLPPLEVILARYSYEPETGRFYSVEHGRRSVACVQRQGSDYRSLYFFRPYGSYAAHRIAWRLIHGRDPAGFVDHINGVRDDNRPCNLREVSHAENMRNVRRGFWRAEKSRRASYEQMLRAQAKERRVKARSGIATAVLGFGA